MKKVSIILIAIISILLLGCSSLSNNKILNIIELNKTTRENISELNLEIKNTKVWSDEKGVFILNYIGDYSDYTLNNATGTICIYFNNNTAQFVSFSAEATYENMSNLLSYLIDTYGESYIKVEDYTTRWSSGKLIIDYILTDEGNIEIKWYENNL